MSPKCLGGCHHNAVSLRLYLTDQVLSLLLSFMNAPFGYHRASWKRALYKGIGRGVTGLMMGVLTTQPAIAQSMAQGMVQGTAQSTIQTIASNTDAAHLFTVNVPAPALESPGQPVTQVARRQASDEIRSIWLDRETIVNAESAAGLAPIFERFKAAGINTVFVETVNAGYPIYPSEVAPEQNPLIRGWDPLQAAVDLGKAHGIEVHAWVWLFAAGNQAHNSLVGKPESYPGPILSARPDWAGMDNQGNLIIPGQNKTFLDPANPEVRQYLLDVIDEIATRYDVDGIQLDYVRYPFQDQGANRTFGYGTAAREQFHQLTGVDPITLSPRNGGSRRMAQLWSQWTNFRMRQVTSFVAVASQRLRDNHPGLKLSAAVFAENTYKRHHDLQQDWENWAERGLVDWIVLMSYADNTQHFEQLIRPWVIEANYESTAIIPGIRLLNLPTSEAYNQIQMVRDMPAGGYALFAADNLDGEVQSMLAGVNDDDGVEVATNPRR